MDFIPCPQCGDDIHAERWALGYRSCLWCGEEATRLEMQESKQQARHLHSAHRANHSYSDHNQRTGSAHHA